MPLPHALSLSFQLKPCVSRGETASNGAAQLVVLARFRARRGHLVHLDHLHADQWITWFLTARVRICMSDSRVLEILVSEILMGSLEKPAPAERAFGIDLVGISRARQKVWAAGARGPRVPAAHTPRPTLA